MRGSDGAGWADHPSTLACSKPAHQLDAQGLASNGAREVPLRDEREANIFPKKIMVSSVGSRSVGRVEKRRHEETNCGPAAYEEHCRASPDEIE